MPVPSSRARHPDEQAGGQLPSLETARSALDELKAELMGRGEATELFARDRGDGLASLLGNLDQSVFGEPAYPSIESKAAHLLYFVSIIMMAARSSAVRWR